jgi:hypothetical protein
MCGNMLSFSSLIDLADAYQKNGYNLLTFNLKAHDCIAEGVYSEENDVLDEFYYVGGSLESFERRFVDIQCAIDFASTFSDKVILQGHSMGCESIIAFQITNGESYYDTILISPCNAYKLQNNYIAPMTIDEQLVELENYSDRELLPPYFYGINCPNTNIGKYTIPIYKGAMKSILTGLALKVFRQDVSLDYFLPIACICVLGKNDPMQTYHHEDGFKSLKPKFNSFLGIAINGDHEIKPCQDELTKCIINWLKNRHSIG